MSVVIGKANISGKRIRVIAWTPEPQQQDRVYLYYLLRLLYIGGYISKDGTYEKDLDKDKVRSTYG